MSDPSTPITSSATQVFVNGEPEPVPSGSTIAALLAQLDLAGKRVAVALNREVVPRSAHGEVRLTAGDRVEILEAVGGG